MGSSYTSVFTPLEIRGVEYKNRIEMAPTSPKYPSKEGYVTDKHIEYFRPIARGGAAIITMGNCSVDLKHAQDEPRQLAIDNDDYIIGYSRLVDLCEGYGAQISAEVNHAGLDALPEFNDNFPAIGPSAIPLERELRAAKSAGREPIAPIEMDLETIKKVQQMYIDAASRLKRAGFNMCMIHGGHANLIGQFSSPLYNKRSDEYGGSLENRARFCLEILEGVRKKVGDDFVIELRLSADEMHPEGMHFDESKKYFQMIDDLGIVDIMNISAGMHTALPYFKYWSPNMYMPRNVNVKYAAELKKILNCKIATVAGIMNIPSADKIISDGFADFVAMARPIMADPDLVKNAAHDRADATRPCTRCNWCSGYRIIKRRTVACAVNPLLGREDELFEGKVPKAAEKKNVVVVGGGPAGMQAALTLMQRGHTVTLFEREDHLGGNLIASGAMKLKQEMRAFSDFFCKQVAECGADIRLNTQPSTDDIIALEPDGIILATGADPFVPDIEGIDLPHVHWAADYDLGTCEIGEKVAVIGAGFVSLEAAWSVVDAGKEAAVFKRSLKPAMNSQLMHLTGVLKEANVPFFEGCKVVEIKPNCVIYEDSEGKQGIYECDTVLFGCGMTPRREFIDEFRHLAPETSVFVVGDARSPRMLGDAMHDGFNAAMYI